MAKGNSGLAKSLLSMGSAMVILLGINFFLTPFVTEKLGADAYGFITLANNIVSYAMMLTTALNSFATRYIAVEYHRGNCRGASCYLSSLLIANGAVCAVIFTAMLVFVININGILQVPDHLLNDVQYLFVLVFVNFLFTNGSAAFSSAAYVKDRLDLYGLFQSLSYVVEALALIVLYLVLPPHVLYFGVGIALAGLVLLSGNIYIYRKVCPEIQVSFSLFSFSAVKTLLFSGLWNSFNQLGNILNSGLSLLVANMFLNPIAMGQVAISQVFTTVSRRLYQLISQVYQPRLLKYYSNGDMTNLCSELTSAMKVSALIGCLIFAGYWSLGLVFNSLWIPSQDINLIYKLALVVLFSEIAVAPIFPLYFIYTLTVKNKIPAIVTIIGGISSVVLMAALIKLGFGAFSVVIPTTLINCIINGVVNPLYMARCLRIKLSTFFPTLLRVDLLGIVMCMLFTVLRNAICPITWLSFCVCAILCLVVGLLAFLVIAFDPNERKQLLSFVNRKQQEL